MSFTIMRQNFLSLTRNKLLAHTFSRNILTESYSCKQLWRDRLSSPAFTSQSATDLGTQIMHRLSKNVPISPIDYDIFLNKIEETDVSFLEFVEKIIYQFRLTQNALHVLPSSSHAVVHAYMHHNVEDRLIKLLNDRANTGIFLDEFSGNLLLSHAVKKDNYSLALLILWELCLQSHLEQHNFHPYLFSLWLHVVSKFVRVGDISKISKEEEIEDDNENQEIDYQRIPYIRNANYDAWFDITEPRLKLGHCFLSLARAIDRQTTDPSAKCNLPEKSIPLIKSLSPSLMLIGFALTGNLCGILEITRKAKASPIDFPYFNKEMFDGVEKLLNSLDRCSDDVVQKPGEPIILTESQVSTAIDYFKEFSTTFQVTCELSFYQTADNLVKSIINDPIILEKESTRIQNFYAGLKTIREQTLKAEQEKLKRKQILDDVKQKLRELTDEEERLTFFDNNEIIERSAWLAPRTLNERQWSRLKEWKKEITDHQNKKQASRESLSEA